MKLFEAVLRRTRGKGAGTSELHSGHANLSSDRCLLPQYQIRTQNQTATSIKHASMFWKVTTPILAVDQSLPLGDWGSCMCSKDIYSELGIQTQQSKWTAGPCIWFSGRLREVQHSAPGTSHEGCDFWTWALALSEIPATLKCSSLATLQAEKRKATSRRDARGVRASLRGGAAGMYLGEGDPKLFSEWEVSS